MAAPSGEPWTVDRAVAAALRQSPDVHSARHRIEAGEAMLAQINSAWQPQLTLAGSYTRTNGALGGLGFALNQRAFSPSLDLNRPGWADNLNVTGTVSYNLYDGGRPTARREAARAGVRAAGSALSAAYVSMTVASTLACATVKPYTAPSAPGGSVPVIHAVAARTTAASTTSRSTTVRDGVWPTAIRRRCVKPMAITAMIMAGQGGGIIIVSGRARCRTRMAGRIWGLANTMSATSPQG